MACKLTITIVPLTDGESVEVRRLGMFELDDIPRDIKPYTVPILFSNGVIYEQTYDYSQVREKPFTPFEEAEERTQVWYDWLSHLRYQDALTHRRRNNEAYADYCERVKDYILAYCVTGDVLVSSLSHEDWQAILHAALCPHVTLEEVRAAVSVTFPGDV